MLGERRWRTSCNQQVGLRLIDKSLAPGIAQHSKSLFQDVSTLLSIIMLGKTAAIPRWHTTYKLQELQ